MSFNIWVGGQAGQQPLSQTSKVIHAAQADIVGIQESHGERRHGKRPDAAQAMADTLNWHYFDQGDEDTGVLSRHKITGHTPNKWGVRIELPSRSRVWLFNAHFAHAPYQPYQLLKIPYEDAPFLDTAEQAVDAARAARHKQVSSMLAEIEAVKDEGTPIFITGDFNEPPCLDWTDTVYRTGRCPAVVSWPTTEAVLKAGFVDAYRQVHPDPLARPGYTWTPITAEDDPDDRHDRIDFVLIGGRYGKIEKAEIVGERRPQADIVVDPYPSDHRGVIVTVTLE